MCVGRGERDAALCCAIEGTRARILDTRKDFAGFGLAQKYAVRVGAARTSGSRFTRHSDQGNHISARGLGAAMDAALGIGCRRADPDFRWRRSSNSKRRWRIGRNRSCSYNFTFDAMRDACA